MADGTETEDLKPLNDKQEMFCQHYIIDFNGSKAAIKAGYSEASAKEIASELLTKPNVKARVEELKANILAAVGITQARTYREISRLGYADIRDAYDDKGSLKPVKELPDEIAASIVGIKVYDEFVGSGKEREKIGETVEVKFADKLSALAQIVKIAGWAAPDKVEHSGLVWHEQRTYEAKPETDTGA